MEWAHAIAPGANILLVEANSNTNSDLYTAVDYARHATGVVAVSMSWSNGEYSGETSDDSHFTTPAGHAGVTFLAPSGDAGAPPSYPSISPNVVSVGGTSLYLTAQNAYSSEAGWSNSGGGISADETQPAYQTGVVTQSTTLRTNPDVAYDSNPATGFPVYDSYNNGTSTPWGEWGGTSAAVPQWAALVAIADQGRALAGKGSLDGVTQTLPALYGLPAADFHDITTGSSSTWPYYAAGPGYDLVTGRGTPYANQVIPALVSATWAPTSTTLGVSTHSPTYGQSVTITAAVSVVPPSTGTPTGGTVTFTAGGTTLGTAPLSAGKATLTTTSLPGGLDELSAAYSGYGLTFAASSTTGLTSITVTPAPLTVSAENATKPYGAADPTFSVSYSGFVHGENFWNLSGTLGYTTNEPATGFAPAGTYMITPTGLTSSNYAITFTPGTLTVTPAQTTVTVSASATSLVIGQPLTLTATVTTLSPSTATPSGGTVTFYVDGVAQPNPVPLVGNSETLADASLLLGPHIVTASYSGDGIDFAAGNTAIVPSSIITTVAGNGNSGYSGDGGSATAAMLDGPDAVATDASGDIFIADTVNNRVREVDHATGLITTIAGNGTDSYSGDNGPATAAGVGEPAPLAIDAQGNLFIGQSTFVNTGAGIPGWFTYQPVIREVNLHTGVITTVAGNGTTGYSGDGGQATAASLGYDLGLAVDTGGDLFIADANNERVREVNLSTGIINTVAGNGTAGYSGDNGQATAAELSYVDGITVDRTGHLFIASNNRVREVDLSTGLITTVAGGGSSSSAALAMSGLTMSPGGVNTYSGGTVVSGGTLTLNGGGSSQYGGDGGPATAALLDQPTGLSADAAGNLFIADSGNERVRAVVQATGDIITVAGNGNYGYGGDGGPAGAASLYYPASVATDASGNLYIADEDNDRIREVSAGAAHVNVFQATTLNLGAPGPTTYGGTVTLSATLSSGGAGVPNETVTFSAGGKNLGTATTDANGVATLAAASLAGSYTGGLVASFSGDASYMLVSAVADLTVNKAPLTVTANSASKPYGAPDPTFSVSYAGMVGGDGPSVLGGTLAYTTNEPATGYASPGSFTVTPAGLTSNNYAITFDPGALTVTEAQTTTTVSISASPVLNGQSLTVTATVAVDLPSTATPTGTVTFSIDGVAQPNPPALSGSRATLVDSSLSLGPHTITASYSGDGTDFGASTSLAVGPSSIITTVAGDGVCGYGGDGGSATAAYLHFPAAVAVDATGDIFIADQNSNRVREVVQTTGEIITVVGGGNSGHVYVQRGESYTGMQLWSFNAETGAVAWSAPFGAQANSYYAPTVGNGSVFVAGGEYGGMYGFNQASGKQLFFDGEPTLNEWTPSYYNNHIYTWVAGMFTEYSPTSGTADWWVTLGGNWSGYSMNTVPAINAGRAFMAGTTGLFAVDLATHRELWQVNTKSFSGSPAVANGVVYVISGSTVEAFNAADGTQVGTFTAGEALLTGQQPIVTDDALIVASASKTYIFSLSQHTQVGSLPVGGQVTLANNELYVASRDGPLYAYSIAQPGVATTTTLSASTTRMSYGQAVTFTATVSAPGSTAPNDGTVAFVAGGTTLGTAPVTNGHATLAVSTLPAGSDVVTAIYSGDGANYAGGISAHGASVTIAPAPLAVTANNADKVYGAADPTFSVSYSGFVNGESLSNLGGTLKFTTTEPSGGNTAIGAYQIRPSGLTSSNYTITYVTGKLTVIGPFSLSKSTITVPASQVTSGNSATVTLVARDANGNQELGGGLVVAFGLGTGSASGTFGAVTDNGNGTYTATFTGSKAGSNTIIATIGGQKVTSTPPTVTVTSAVSRVAANDAALMAVLADGSTDVTGSKLAALR